MDREQQIELDVLSRKMTQKLMQTEEFQELWVELAKRNQTFGKSGEATKRRNGNEQTKVTNRQNDTSDLNDFAVPKVHFLEIHNKKAQNSHDWTGKLIADELGQFVRAIRLAMGVFKDGTQMARFEDQLPPAKMISPDSVSLYMAHIRLERFCASEHFHVGKFGLATRQIANLLRAFTQRVSGIYSLERCSFLADSLFRLFTKFYECIKWHFRQSPNKSEIEKFGAAILKFGRFVCGTLREMQTVKEPNISQNMTTRHWAPNLNWASPSAFPILINRKATNHIQRRQRGFLLSPELDYDRHRIAVTIHSSKNKTEDKRKKRAKNNHRENKSFDREFFRFAGPTEIDALRGLCKLTLEYLDEMKPKSNQQIL
ncbi:hypothetical protein niasHS_010067 [Heterodera schachtii]|uniref:Uncharacterized protein n=1 Tax=Heterodera schachtii TaxID=97005 RepID=A0ABD2J5Z8_HETSC